jgi:hypothetical protein
MTRNRASAKAAGSRFERSVADWLRDHLDDRIDRRVKTGAADRGDIGGIRTIGNGRVVAECKDTARVSLGTWQTEAETERGNDDAVASVILHKRHGVADPAQQWVTCTLTDFVALITGQRPEEH